MTTSWPMAKQNQGNNSYWDNRSPESGAFFGVGPLSFKSSRSPIEQLAGPQPGLMPNRGKTNCTMMKYRTTNKMNFSIDGPFGSLHRHLAIYIRSLLTRKVVKNRTLSRCSC